MGNPQAVSLPSEETQTSRLRFHPLNPEFPSEALKGGNEQHRAFFSEGVPKQEEVVKILSKNK